MHLLGDSHEVNSVMTLTAPSIVATKEVIGRLLGTAPRIVVINNKATAQNYVGRYAFETCHHGVVPVAIDVGYAHWRVYDERVLEASRYQLDVWVIWVNIKGA